MAFHDTNLHKKPDFTGFLRTGYHSTAQDLTALWNSNPSFSATHPTGFDIILSDVLFYPTG